MLSSFNKKLIKFVYVTGLYIDFFGDFACFTFILSTFNDLQVFLTFLSQSKLLFKKSPP